MTAEITEKDIKRLNDTVREVSSYDFSDYSFNSFKRRIVKFLEDHSTDIESVIKNLRRDYNFLEKFVKNITVNTTEIFRDPDTWIYVRQVLEQKYSKAANINIWHAGCSTGQEVYSMLILLEEAGLLEKATVFASDINVSVLNAAMKGFYRYHEISGYIDNFNKALNSPKTAGKYPPVDISKYLEINQFKDYVKVADFLVEKPVFIKHDLVSCRNIFDMAFDIIFCRNVLIYFNHDLQNRVINFFYENLAKNGCLVIGRHEGILGTLASNFNKKESLYFKRADAE